MFGEGNGTPLQYSCLENPTAEEPGRLQSMGLLRVRHDWATSLSLFTFMHWRRKWQPTPVFLPGECQGWRSLVGCRLWGRTNGHKWSDLAAAAAANLIKALKLVSWICWVRWDSHMNNDCCIECRFFCPFVVISWTTKGTATLRTLRNSPKWDLYCWAKPQRNKVEMA